MGKLEADRLRPAGGKQVNMVTQKTREWYIILLPFVDRSAFMFGMVQPLNKLQFCNHLSPPSSSSLPFLCPFLVVLRLSLVGHKSQHREGENSYDDLFALN
jgi:hypothetical protein